MDCMPQIIVTQGIYIQLMLSVFSKLMIDQVSYVCKNVQAWCVVLTRESNISKLQGIFFIYFLWSKAFYKEWSIREGKDLIVTEHSGLLLIKVGDYLHLIKEFICITKGKCHCHVIPLDNRLISFCSQDFGGWPYSINTGCSPLPLFFVFWQSNKVPVVQHPHHVHPLTPLITYSNEHFTPGNPPPHLPADVDPKTGRWEVVGRSSFCFLEGEMGGGGKPTGFGGNPREDSMYVWDSFPKPVSLLIETCGARCHKAPGLLHLGSFASAFLCEHTHSVVVGSHNSYSIWTSDPGS